MATEIEAKQLKALDDNLLRLWGARIMGTATMLHPADGKPQAILALQSMDGQPIIVHVLADPEGNGAGHLDIDDQPRIVKGEEPRLVSLTQKQLEWLRDAVNGGECADECPYDSCGSWEDTGIVSGGCSRCGVQAALFGAK